MWIFLTRLLRERESHKRCERKWGSEDVFSSSALLLCALTHNVFPKTRQSIISEWSDYINCCVAVSDKQSCQRSMLQITLGHHHNLLYWTHLARWAVLCVLISSQRVFVSFFLLPGSAARDIHLNIFSNIEAYSFMSCGTTGSKTQGFYVCLPRLPKIQLLRGPLIINRCTLSKR